MLGLGVVPPIIQLICLFFVPETQRWLAKNDRYEVVEQVLVRVYKGEESVQVELDKLKKEVY